MFKKASRQRVGRPPTITNSALVAVDDLHVEKDDKAMPTSRCRYRFFWAVWAVPLMTSSVIELLWLQACIEMSCNELDPAPLLIS
jgi:hypothetical protein